MCAARLVGDIENVCRKAAATHDASMLDSIPIMLDAAQTLDGRSFAVSVAKRTVMILIAVAMGDWFWIGGDGCLDLHDLGPDPVMSTTCIHHIVDIVRRYGLELRHLVINEEGDTLEQYVNTTVRDCENAEAREQLRRVRRELKAALTVSQAP